MGEKSAKRTEMTKARAGRRGKRYRMDNLSDGDGQNDTFCCQSPADVRPDGVRVRSRRRIPTDLAQQPGERLRPSASSDLSDDANARHAERSKKARCPLAFASVGSASDPAWAQW